MKQTLAMALAIAFLQIKCLSFLLIISGYLFARLFFISPEYCHLKNSLITSCFIMLSFEHPSGSHMIQYFSGYEILIFLVFRFASSLKPTVVFSGLQRTCEGNAAGENRPFNFTVCVKSVNKLTYVVLHIAFKECFETNFQK